MDILDLAIEKLYANADEYGVTSNICGIVKSIDDYQIKEKNQYQEVVKENNTYGE